MKKKMGAKNNGTSTAASPMQDAKKHVKDAQNAVAQMMAGNNSVTMDQVNGNISLALDAMNNLTVSMSNGTSNGTSTGSNNATSTMLVMQSMSKSMQADLTALDNACSNA